MAKADHPTRERLLDAAGEIFAALGYRATTIRDICERANANIASVNYHFRDKEQLYESVIRAIHAYTLEHYPTSATLTRTDSPRDDLAQYIHCFLLRTLDDSRPEWHGKLLAREMAEPTAQLDFLVDTFIKPEFRRLREIVGELLGASAEHETTQLYASSIIGQCLLHHNRKAMFTRLYPKSKSTKANIEALANHIYEFSLAAILAKSMETKNKRRRA